MEEMDMKDVVKSLVLVLVTCALVASSAWGQGATAQISGTVKDGTGAVLPGAEVTATQTETAIARMTVSNETGTYVLPNLALGPYRLEVSVPGFGTFVEIGIVLQVTSGPVINATRDAVQRSEHIEVQTNADLVATRTSALGQRR